MIKIGVLGAGHLGSIHLRMLNEISAFEVVGIYDRDTAQAAEVAEMLGVKAWEDATELVMAVDAVDIVAPVAEHFELAKLAMKRFKHVFIQKPVTATLAQARALMALAREAQVKVQVGHEERFNPAFLALAGHDVQPMYLEAQRHTQWHPGHRDSSVVLDMMLHDIDLALSLVPHGVKKISATGVKVVSNTPDIVQARIEFHNGCVANLTASRISLENTRKMRIFQRGACVAVDFLNKKTEVFHMQPEAKQPEAGQYQFEIATEAQTKYFTLETPPIVPANPVKAELEDFAIAIQNDTLPRVGLEEAINALDCAFQIVEKINHLCVV